LGRTPNGQPPHLGHGLHDENTRHHRCLGIMSLEKGLVDGDILDRHNPVTFFTLQHPIHHQKRIAMGQESLNLINGELLAVLPLTPFAKKPYSALIQFSAQTNPFPLLYAQTLN
jgi:hypothetical protein